MLESGLKGETYKSVTCPLAVSVGLFILTNIVT
jgi:hypothetical protein